eukprot:CAMPEP_0167742710 /NCGR_PEP_ID=MMETSP0110_2-20121227/1591_1 /TAXON_ID=629695 /ORGANISM="Gymnochlora sp., Strain CCMP2014" /LENGTH=87 /DNA_ID=CAMNT_0007626959 /DNA_START=139 /DNA_END=399 /DNA_ORIENTATION=+
MRLSNDDGDDEDCDDVVSYSFLFTYGYGFNDSFVDMSSVDVISYSSSSAYGYGYNEESSIFISEVFVVQNAISFHGDARNKYEFELW